MALFLVAIPGPLMGDVLSHFGTNEGLAGRMCYYLQTDQDGFLWIATESGASRFDGARFENFRVSSGLPDNEVYGIHCDSKGRMWFLPETGNPCFYFQGRIENAQNNPMLAAIKARDMYSAFFEDRDGNIWISGKDGSVFRIDPQGEVTLPHIFSEYGSPHIRGIWQAENGDLWFGSDDPHAKRGILINMSRDCYLLRPEKQAGAFYPGYTFAGAEKVIFSQDGKLFELDMAASRLRELTTDAGAIPMIHYLKYDLQENLLYVGSDIGAYVFRQEGGRLLRVKHYLPGHSVSCILRDFEGNIWFSTLESGIYCAKKHALEVWDRSVGLPADEVMKISVGQSGAVWLGQESPEAICLQNGELRSVSLPLQSNVVCYDIYAHDDGSAWLLSDLGLYVIWKDEVKRVDRVRGKVILADTSGDLLLPPYFVIDPTTARISRFNPAPPEVGKVYAAMWEDGKTMILGAGKGVFRKRGEQVDRLFPDSKITGVKSTGIIRDQTGQIWISSNGAGIGLIQGQKLLEFTPEHGMPEGIVSAIQCDQDNRIWAGTDRGLVVMRYEEDRNPKLEMQILTTAHGLPSDQINDIVIDSGTIYLATGAGLCIFRPEELIQSLPSPLVRLTGVAFNGKPVDLRDRYDLPYSSNDLEVELTGISFRNAENVRFRYRLEPLETDWHPTVQRTISYHTIPPGEYTLIVQGASLGENWSPGTHLNLVIRPPFWKTGWFLAGVILLGLGLVWGLAYTRIRVLKRRAKMQHRIAKSERQAIQAQMNPHFIFNTLNSIQNLVVRNQTTEAMDYLNRFGQMIRSSLRQSRERSISLDAEMAFLRDYLELERLRLGERFGYTMVLEGDYAPENIRIPAFCLQPFVENTIWHGFQGMDQPGRLDIVFRVEEAYLMVTVRDDGIGREQARSENVAGDDKRPSYGIRIVEETLALLRENEGHKDASLEISDLYDAQGKAAGTEVRISLPIEL